MAKDKKGPGIGKKSGADYRASHRAYSAASADRKKAMGMTRVSAWVPASRAEALKRYAKRLCEGHEPETNAGNQAGSGWVTLLVILFIGSRRKRKTPQPDDRQRDLFGSA
jgi:hypothetical protein